MKTFYTLTDPGKNIRALKMSKTIKTPKEQPQIT